MSTVWKCKKKQVSEFKYDVKVQESNCFDSFLTRINVAFEWTFSLLEDNGSPFY
jgi:hypothetical protein